MKVLVTGSEGYIGTILVDMLLKKGMEVEGIDICYFSEGNLNNVTFPNYTLNKKDVRDITIDDLKGKNFDAIVSLAALSNDPLGKLDSELTYDINYRASVNLAKLGKDLGITRYVFASSCSLYGQGDSSALTEESPSNPQTAYGKSKIMAENALSELADDTFSPCYMRNATAFGYSPRMRFDIVVNSLTAFAKVDNEIKILGDGKPWRPLVHVNDICKAIITVLEAPRKKIHNQAFNVGSNTENYQIKTIAEKVKDAYTTCNISIAQKDAQDTRDYNVSFKKINELLNYDIDWSLPKGIYQLKTIYDAASIDKNIFESRLYTRLNQINYLLDNNLINKELRFNG